MEPSGSEAAKRSPQLPNLLKSSAGGFPCIFSGDKDSLRLAEDIFDFLDFARMLED
jgi:hypothetical protein